MVNLRLRKNLFGALCLAGCACGVICDESRGDPNELTLASVKIVGSGTVAGDNFGYSVAADQDLVLVGSFLKGDCTYLFNVSDPTNPIETAIFDSPPVSRYLGIHGDIVVMGTPGVSAVHFRDGRVLMYDVSDPWNPMLVNTLFGEYEQHKFGTHFAFDNDLLVVGSGDRAFTVLDIADPTNPVRYPTVSTPGHITSIAVDGNRVLIGASDEGDHDEGEVYLYEFADFGVAVAPQIITAPNPFLYDMFGSSVGLNGPVAICCGIGFGPSGDWSGAALVFDDSGAGPAVQRSTAALAAGQANDRFGASMSMLGGLGLIGAIERTTGAERPGSAYMFDFSDPSSPIERGRVFASDGADGDRFGWNVALTETYGVVSAPWHDAYGEDAGAVYIFPACGSSSTGPFDLTWPDDGALLTGSVPFEWEHSTCADMYRLVVADNPQMAHPIIDIQTPHTTFIGESTLLPRSSVFYWEVTSLNAFGSAGAVSGIRTFETTTAVYEFDLLTPGEDAVLTPGFGFRFEWEDVATASSYRIMVDDSADMSSLLYDIELGNSFINWPGSIFEAGRTYFWNVEAESEFLGTTLVAGETPRALHIALPDACVDGDANRDGTVDVNDVSYVLFRLGGTCPPCAGDANGDSAVDVNDISYVLFRLGNVCP